MIKHDFILQHDEIMEEPIPGRKAMRVRWSFDGETRDGFLVRSGSGGPQVVCVSQGPLRGQSFTKSPRRLAVKGFILVWGNLTGWFSLT